MENTDQFLKAQIKEIFGTAMLSLHKAIRLTTTAIMWYGLENLWPKVKEECEFALNELNIATHTLQTAYNNSNENVIKALELATGYSATISEILKQVEIRDQPYPPLEDEAGRKVIDDAHKTIARLNSELSKKISKDSYGEVSL